MQFLIRFILYALAVLITGYILPGVNLDSFLIAIVVAGVLALLNAVVKPVLVILTIPITFFTLGLFLLVINALIIMLASWIVPGFEVANFWWALIFSIVLSFFTFLFTANSSFRGP